MEQKESFEEMHRKIVEKAEEYLKTKQDLTETDKEKLHSAKSEWQLGWNRFLETLAYLEQLEI